MDLEEYFWECMRECYEIDQRIQKMKEESERRSKLPKKVVEGVQYEIVS